MRVSNIDPIEYKGYVTHINYDDGVFFGKIEGISDLVLWEAERTSDAEKAFAEAVDDYLLFCEEECVMPDVPTTTANRAEEKEGQERG